MTPVSTTQLSQETRGTRHGLVLGPGWSASGDGQSECIIYKALLITVTWALVWTGQCDCPNIHPTK